MQEVGRETGLPVVTEVMDTRLVEQVGEHVDMLQIGSRNMQNYPLLVEVGRYGKPVLLKRGMAASLCEWLGAAEYIAKEGNLQIVLCERGIKAYPSGEYARFILDLNVVTAVKAETFLPVIVDPSHATGIASMVEPASRAAIESGCHGLLIEIASDRPGAARSPSAMPRKPSIPRRWNESSALSDHAMLMRKGRRFMRCNAKLWFISWALLVALPGLVTVPRSAKARCR